MYNRESLRIGERTHNIAIVSGTYSIINIHHKMSHCCRQFHYVEKTVVDRLFFIKILPILVSRHLHTESAQAMRPREILKYLLYLCGDYDVICSGMWSVPYGQ